jgi:hypothetical protein
MLDIRGEQIALSHNKSDYINAGIELKEYEPGKISIEEVCRLLITTHQALLRATDEELYKSLPKDLEKIMVIDEWHHRDFIEMDISTISDEHLRRTYEFNKNLGSGPEYMEYEKFAAMFRQQEQSNVDFNHSQREDNRPGSYDTWQLIAKVIATGDISFYKPKSQPNSHWMNWLDSGHM